MSADLREDWFGVLREAGFSPKQPTAWLAEGLLPYLTAATETALFDADVRPDSVGRLSSAGWELEDKSVFEFTAEYCRGPEADVVDAIASARWVIGAKRA